jgi:hypothetical protein
MRDELKNQRELIMIDTMRELKIDEVESVSGGRFGWGPVVSAVQGAWQTGFGGSYLSDAAVVLSRSGGCPAGCTCT